MMEKQNVVEQRRTPPHEIDTPAWDKTAAAEFKPAKKPEVKKAKVPK